MKLKYDYFSTGVHKEVTKCIVTISTGTSIDVCTYNI